MSGKPSEVFKQHVYVSPYHEDPMAPLADAIGPDHVLFGSDYPHSEGVAEPIEFAEALEGFDADSTRRIMRENTSRLLRLS